MPIEINKSIAKMKQASLTVNDLSIKNTHEFVEYIEEFVRFFKNSEAKSFCS